MGLGHPLALKLPLWRVWEDVGRCGKVLKGVWEGVEGCRRVWEAERMSVFPDFLFSLISCSCPPLTHTYSHLLSHSSTLTFTHSYTLSHTFTPSFTPLHPLTPSPSLPRQPFTIDSEGVIRNTEPLDYEKSHNHILSVVAYDCGMKRSQPVMVTVKVNRVCRIGWKGELG